jgi:(p)ppGpp synthase/HD superfamily hydrolase
MYRENERYFENDSDYYKADNIKWKAILLVEKLLGRNYYEGHIERGLKVLDTGLDYSYMVYKFKMETAFILHDIVEDYKFYENIQDPITVEYLAKEFTPEISELVKELTKDEVTGEFPNLKSYDGKVLKMVDRYVNMTSSFLRESKKLEYASTLDHAFDTKQKSKLKEIKKGIYEVNLKEE